MVDGLEEVPVPVPYPEVGIEEDANEELCWLVVFEVDEVLPELLAVSGRLRKAEPELIPLFDPLFDVLLEPVEVDWLFNEGSEIEFDAWPGMEDTTDSVNPVAIVRLS